jgi:hypothetical protein
VFVSLLIFITLKKSICKMRWNTRKLVVTLSVDLRECKYNMSTSNHANCAAAAHLDFNITRPIVVGYCLLVKVRMDVCRSDWLSYILLHNSSNFLSLTFWHLYVLAQDLLCSLYPTLLPTFWETFWYLLNSLSLSIN